jgi:hypothetical protein
LALHLFHRFAARCDDLNVLVNSVGRDRDAAAKEAARTAACADGGEIHAMLEKLENFVATHGDKARSAVARKLNIADLQVRYKINIHLTVI